MGAKFSVALCDDLQREYCRYKNGEDGINRNIINRILRYGAATSITNEAQLARIGYAPDSSLRMQLRKNSLIHQSVEELAGKTIYKIVLSDSRDEFPYVNVMDDAEPVKPMTGGCFFRDMPREKAKRHIAELCASAKRSILIYDAYLDRDPGPVTDLLSTFLPDRKLDIIHHPGQLPPDMQARLKRLHSNFTFVEKVMPTHHDRYIIVDDKIEIILTSGFYNLATTVKELTYIVRECPSSRFA